MTSPLHYSDEFKQKVVSTVLEERHSIQEIAHIYGITPLLVTQWQDEHFKRPAVLMMPKNTMQLDEAILGRVVLDSTRNLITVYDPATYEILYLNKASKEIHKITHSDEYRGKHCYSFFFGYDQPCSFCNTATEDPDHELPIFYPKLGKYYSSHRHKIRIGNRDLCMEVAVDIDNEQQKIRKLDSELKKTETLLECIKTLSITNDMNQAIEEMLKIVCEFHEGSRSYIYELSEDGEYLDTTYEWCRTDIAPQIHNLQHLPKSFVSHWFKKFEEREEFYITDLIRDIDPSSPQYQTLSNMGVCWMIAAPLLENGKIIGFLGVDDPAIRVENFDILASVTLFVNNDIQKRRLVSDLQHSSYYDNLTHLYNRNKYTQHLQELQKSKPLSLGVVYIDINGLKLSNDRYGHDYGDYLLSSLAKMLTRLYHDQVYRIGGDEFVVLLSNISKEDFDERSKTLRNLISKEERFSAAIGATWEHHAHNIKQLIKHADDLMYANKQQFYQNIYTVDYNHESLLAKKLLNEISTGMYEVYLQPKIDLISGMLCGAEALIRGIDREDNIIGPDSFIPSYEANGTIRHIDFFVIRTVCSLLHNLRDSGKAIGPISVNISRTTLLEYGVVDSMLEICNEYGIHPSQLIIEVTETESRLKMDEFFSIFARIKEAGFIVSLDDYGVKHSNIAMLTNVVFDEIKLDKSIICELSSNERTQIIARHTVLMFKDLKLCKVVAEGIETSEELALVKAFDFDCGQGYYFSRPLPIAQFLAKYIVV